MPRRPVPTKQDRNITIQPGEEGCIIRRSGEIEMILPTGAKMMSERGRAMVMAAFQCVNDEAFRATQLKQIELLYSPVAGTA